MLSFLTAALLMGVQGFQDLTVPSRAGGTAPAVEDAPERSGDRIRLPQNPFSRSSQTADSSETATAGGAGGVEQSNSSRNTLPSPEIQALATQSSTKAPPRRPSHLSRIQGRTVGEFVPAIAQLPELLHTLPDQVVQVVVDLSDRQVYVYKGTSEVGRYPVAIGMDGWETPVGQFQVIDMQVDPHWQHPITRVDIPPGPDNPLGSRWIAFLPMGDGVIGFHGTYQTELIGQAVSHGCIRMRNADIEAMYEHLQMGVPVIVRD